MSELADRMNLIASTLASRYPSRVVTRSWKDFAARDAADLQAGIYTVTSQGEEGYENLLMRAAMDGKQDIVLLGQIQLAETAEPSDIEDAEFVMVDEVKAFVRDLPADLCCLNMTAFQQSGQIDAPFGWIAVKLEFAR